MSNSTTLSSGTKLTPFGETRPPLAEWWWHIPFAEHMIRTEAEQKKMRSDQSNTKSSDNTTWYLVGGVAGLVVILFLFALSRHFVMKRRMQ